MAVATVTGVLTLAGYLFPHSRLGTYRDRLVEWAVIVVAFAFILGLLNVLNVHRKRVRTQNEGWTSSVVLLLAAAVFWIPPVVVGVSGGATQLVFDYVVTPLAASLAALLVFTLTLAAFRLVRQRRSLWSVFFVIIVSVILLGTTPIQGLEWLSDVRQWLIAVPAMAGIRGLLLGVALGIVITGLRVLFTQDRPYTHPQR